MLETKICTRCNCEKEITEFHKQTITKDGYRNICKECRKEYYHSNRKEVLEKHKEYYNLNKEKIALYMKEYSVKYYNLNREKKSEYRKKYRYENSTYFKEYNKEYIKTEKGKVVSANSKHKRRAIEKSGDVTSIQLLGLTKNAKNCYWCNTSLKNKVVHIDHYVALSKGGLHTITNLVVACSECNLKKNAKDPFVFALEKGRLL